MAAISKRISLTTSECDATFQPEVGSHATPKTIFHNYFFSFLCTFYQRTDMLPVTKCPMGPNLHISKIATIHTAKMLIASSPFY